MRKFFIEFKAFAMRGNLVDMAVGIILGAAFGKVVTSFVQDVVMPPIGVLIGGADFANLALTLKAAAVDAAGNAVPAVTLGYGKFLTVALDFVIVAAAVFAVVKVMNALHARGEKKAATTPRDVALLEEIRDLLKAS